MRRLTNLSKTAADLEERFNKIQVNFQISRHQQSFFVESNQKMTLRNYKDGQLTAN